MSGFYQLNIRLTLLSCIIIQRLTFNVKSQMIPTAQATNRIVRSVRLGTIRGVCALLAGGIAIIAAPDAYAEDRLGEFGNQAQALRGRSQGSVKSLDSVIDSARSKGKVLDVELKGAKYRMKVLDTDGRVRNVDVDASGSRGGSSDNGSSSNSGRGSDESSSGRGRGRGR
jgi:uncharacterized membrane protein YkoI